MWVSLFQLQNIKTGELGHVNTTKFELESLALSHKDGVLYAFDRDKLSDKYNLFALVCKLGVKK